MLGKIYNWFTEGFDTHDLREAADLLRTLVNRASRHLTTNGLNLRFTMNFGFNRIFLRL